MPCQSCIQALQAGSETVAELAVFHPDLLPPLPDRIDSWDQVAELLARLAGRLRERAEP